MNTTVNKIWHFKYYNTWYIFFFRLFFFPSSSPPPPPHHHHPPASFSPCFLNGTSTSCWAMASPLPAFRDNWVFTPSPRPGGLGASLLIRHLAHNLSGTNCPNSSYAAVGIVLVWCIQLPLCFERLRKSSLHHILETQKQFRNQTGAEVICETDMLKCVCVGLICLF